MQFRAWLQVPQKIIEALGFSPHCAQELAQAWGLKTLVHRDMALLLPLLPALVLSLLI